MSKAAATPSGVDSLFLYSGGIADAQPSGYSLRTLWVRRAVGPTGMRRTFGADEPDSLIERHFWASGILRSNPANTGNGGAEADAVYRSADAQNQRDGDAPEDERKYPDDDVEKRQNCPIAKRPMERMDPYPVHNPSPDDGSQGTDDPNDGPVNCHGHRSARRLGELRRKPELTRGNGGDEPAKEKRAETLDKHHLGNLP